MILLGVYGLIERDNISKLYRLINEKDFDIILSAPDNIEYFLGFRTIADTPFILYVSKKNGLKLYTTLLDYYRVRDAVEHLGIEVYALSRRVKPGDARIIDKKWPELIEELVKESTEKIGFDKEMESPLRSTVLEKLGDRMIDVSKDIWSMRMVKDEWEIKAIKQAIEITGRGIYEAVNNLNNRVTEAELAGFFEHRVRREGVDEYAFPPLILFKPSNSYPHNLPSNRILGRNNLVLLDVGVKYAGRCSDITRMAIWGRISDEERRTLEAVNEAVDEVIDKAEPGMKAEEIYMLAYRILERNGLGIRFIHGLGHGFGILVHEKPYIAYGVDTVIEPGMVFTVEPGVYIPGKYGVRIEEDVVMTKKGLRVLSRGIKRIL
jgi:Xaa-Pro dipeptidase